MIQQGVGWRVPGVGTMLIALCDIEKQRVGGRGSGVGTPSKTVTSRAFSLVELLFVIAIITLLAALLFPVFERAREQARSAVCFSNMRQIGVGVALYIQDYDETYPMNRMPDATHPIEGCKLTGDNAYPIGSLEDSSINWRRVVQPYLKNKQVMVCPSNPNVERSPAPGIPPGDQTNRYYPPKDYLPLSYAYNGSFFHEAIPPCLYGEKLERPRFLPEIENSSSLIFLLESRDSFPDMGTWFLNSSNGQNGLGPFQSHNSLCTFLFADLHVKRLKLAATCTGKMWTDRYPDGGNGCQHLDQLADEYK